MSVNIVAMDSPPMITYASPLIDGSPPAPGMIIGIIDRTVVSVVIRIGRILDLPAFISAS